MLRSFEAGWHAATGEYESGYKQELTTSHTACALQINDIFDGFMHMCKGDEVKFDMQWLKQKARGARPAARGACLGL